MPPDAELLRRYAAEKSEAAFAELVRRHINLVYSVALRQVGGDAPLAEDVAQQVFTALARKAAAVAARPSLSGWLYRSTHFAASDVVRAERRRRARETEAHLMNEIHAAPASAVDWDKLRPAIDAAIAELDERDRDAVALRFFDGCSFAEVGARLRLTENAARMRVDRALDKLHAALGRRGVTSTAAALGLVLANQASMAAPASLAASVAGTAVAGAAEATSVGAGVVSLVGSAKVAALAGGVVAIMAVTVAIVQHGRVREAVAAHLAAEQQMQALRATTDSFATRLTEAERRAADAERDSRELLQAVEALKSAQAKRGADAQIEARQAAADAEQRAALERGYQQALARRRADEARERARLQEAAVVDLAARRIDVNKMLDAANELYTRGDFHGARQTFNTAMEHKPADLPLPERAAELRALLDAQNVRVNVSFVSDGQTWVMVLGALQPQKLQARTIPLAPGIYEVIGRRSGFQDVAMLLSVRSDVPPPIVPVACTVPVRE